MTWIEGELQPLDVEWLHIEGICQVRENAELLRVTVAAETSGLEGYGYFDLFQLCKNLLNEKIISANVVYLPLNEVPAGVATEIPAFGSVVEIAQIVGVRLIPKETIVGNDSDYMQLKLVNKETGAVICTKTFIAGVDALAYEVTDFGPVDENAGAINFGQGVSLAKEEFGAGMTLPQSVLVIQWDLR
jgi:hypothetical protein